VSWDNAPEPSSLDLRGMDLDELVKELRSAQMPEEDLLRLRANLVQSCLHHRDSVEFLADVLKALEATGRVAIRLLS
jgi:hypothetical protein